MIIYYDVKIKLNKRSVRRQRYPPTPLSGTLTLSPNNCSPARPFQLPLVFINIEIDEAQWML